MTFTLVIQPGLVVHACSLRLLKQEDDKTESDLVAPAGFELITLPGCQGCGHHTCLKGTFMSASEHTQPLLHTHSSDLLAYPHVAPSLAV